MFTVRHANPSDFDKILSLYKKVAEEPIGIARSPEEIRPSYVEDFMQHSRESGIELVIDHPANAAAIIAEIHCYQPGPSIFKHVLGELTIAVHPDFQGQGLGKTIFTRLLSLVTGNRPNILRVELFTQESNQRAQALYQKLGFTAEGRFLNRIPGRNNVLEADIPMAWFNPAFAG